MDGMEHGRNTGPALHSDRLKSRATYSQGEKGSEIGEKRGRSLSGSFYFDTRGLRQSLGFRASHKTGEPISFVLGEGLDLMGKRWEAVHSIAAAGETLCGAWLEQTT
jgi:hypothetical protein